MYISKSKKTMHDFSFFQTTNDPAPRGRSPAELNGKAEKLCTLTDCQCDVKSSMPDGVICIRSKIACLELDEKINELWYEVTMYR